MGGTWAVKGGSESKRSDDVTAEELAFQQMPGRCCMDGEWCLHSRDSNHRLLARLGASHRCDSKCGVPVARQGRS
eukprot:2340254-Prymnesium_polylepis.1